MQFNDPDVIRLAKSIREHESGNNPNPTSKITQTEGSKGYYQFLPATFKSLGDRYMKGRDLNNNPLDINNPDHQNLVAYKYIEDKKNQGFGIDQIAASWNAGEGALTDYKNRKGVNKYGNAYDVPAYVNKVVGTYNTLKAKENPNGMFANSATAQTPEEIRLAQQDEAQLRLLQERGTGEDSQMYKDYKALDTGNETLNTVKNIPAEVLAGVGNEGMRYINKTATTLNSLLGLAGLNSDNPMFKKDTLSNQYVTDKDQAYKSDTNAETAGEWLGWGARQALLLKGASKLQGAAEARIIGKYGAGTTGLGKAARFVAGESVGAIPFIGEQTIEDQGLTGANVGIGLAGALALGLGRGAFASRAMKNIGVKAAVLKGTQEGARFLESPEYKAYAIKKGIDTLEGQQKAIQNEVSEFRNVLDSPIIPKATRLGINDVNSGLYVGDDALKTFLGASDIAINDASKLDHRVTMARLNALEKDVLFPSEEAIKKGAVGIDQLASTISKQVDSPVGQISIPQFKAEVLQAIKDSSMVNKEKTARFVERELDDVASKGQKKVFERLHEKRKALNESFVKTNDNDETFLANQIRAKVAQYGEDPAVKLYLGLNKKYEDIQGAKKITSILEGVDLKKGLGGKMLPLLAGYTAGSLGGGLISPVLFYAAARGTEKLQNKLLNKFLARYSAEKTMGGAANKILGTDDKLAQTIKGAVTDMTESQQAKGKSNLLKDIIRAERNLTEKNVSKAGETLAKNLDNPKVDGALLQRIKKLSDRLEAKTNPKVNEADFEPYGPLGKDIQLGKSKPIRKDDDLPVIDFGESGLTPEQLKQMRVQKEFDTAVSEIPKGGTLDALKKYIKPTGMGPALSVVGGLSLLAGSQPMSAEAASLGERAIEKAATDTPYKVYYKGQEKTITPKWFDTIEREANAPEGLGKMIMFMESTGGTNPVNGIEKSSADNYFGVTPIALKDIGKSKSESLTEAGVNALKYFMSKHDGDNTPEGLWKTYSKKYWGEFATTKGADGKYTLRKATPAEVSRRKQEFLDYADKFLAEDNALYLNNETGTDLMSRLQRMR